jgi:hypothetical protein
MEEEKTVLTKRNVILIILGIIVNYLVYINFSSLSFLFFIFGEVLGMIFVYFINDKPKKKVEDENAKEILQS